MKRISILSVALFITGFILGLVSDASALPTFARKYRTSCTTCHLGFFKLNSFGESFRQNGYIVPGKQDPVLVKEEPVELGAQAWKEVFPDAVWPGSIPSNVPVSFYAHQRVFFTENTNPATNFKFPHEFKLFTGGTLGPAFSFWAEHNLQSSTLNRIFIRINDLFSKGAWGIFGVLPEDALNLRVGRLDVGTLLIPLNVRRTINKPAPYTYEVGSGTTAWDFSDLQSGFEINGVIGHRFLYTAGIVNGLTGSGTPAGVQDNNDEKDLYYRVAYKLGGLSSDGRDWAGSEEGGLRQTDNWAEKSITVGQFAYSGRTTLTGTASGVVENPFSRIGADLRLVYKNLDVYSAIVKGKDERPTITSWDIESWSWFAEADYVIFPWLQAALGYEQVTYEGGNSFKRSPEAIYASLLAWPRANVKLTAEGKIYPDDLDGNSELLVDLTYAY